MSDKKRGFVVYFDLAESLEAFDDAEVGRIFRAMLAYAERGEVLPLPAKEAIAFGFIKKQIERDSEQYDETCAKRKAAAEARWKTDEKKQKMQVHTKNANAYKSMQKMQMDANDADIDTDTEKDTEKDTDTERESILPPKPPTGGTAQKRFSPPTVEMVAEYCQERRNGVDAQRFVDYYSSNGWKVGGRGAMKDWKAAVRTWEGNGYGGGTAKPAPTDAAPVNKYAPKEGTIAAASFNRMLELAKQKAAEREATE